MRDNALFAHFVTVMAAGLAAREVVAKVKQSYQPTTQGVEDGPAIYFTKLPMDKRYGWPQKTDEWNEDHTEFVHTERQNYETTLQVSAMLKEDAADTTGLTASDLGNIAADILQHDDTLAALAEVGLSVLRITEVRSGKIVDGEGEFETIPSFDFTLLHEQVTVSKTPAAVFKDLRIYRV